MSEETTVQQPASLELDNRLYKLEDLSDDAKLIIRHVQQANELVSLKETELVHLKFNRECALEKLREQLKDVESTEKEVATEE